MPPTGGEAHHKRNQTMREYLKVWKNGKLEPGTVPEFTAQLRSYAEYYDKIFSHRSDFRAHLGERLMCAADLIDALARGQPDR